MADEVKYATDPMSAFSNGAMLGANMRGNGNYDPMYAAMMNGGANAWNNPMYLVWMMFASAWMGGGNGFGWGNNGGAAANSQQLQNIQNQMADNHSTDLLMQAVNNNADATRQLATSLNASFDQVNQAICGVRSAIAQNNGDIKLAAEKMLNGVTMASANLGYQIQNTGCGISKEILNQGYQNQLNNLNQTNQIQQGFCNTQNLLQQGFNATQNVVANGFTNIGYQIQTAACNIQQTSCNNTQKILDYLVNSKQLDQATTIQQLRDQVGRVEQTQLLLNAINAKTTTPTTGA
jgi:hypothetical protein